MCVCVCVCIIMEYYSAIKKDEILPFMATWMDLEGIMLREICQTKTNTIWFHLNVESKNKAKQKLSHRNRNQLMVP